MKKKLTLFSIAFFTPLLFLFVFAKTTHAYIDPGSGSYFFQVILAFLLGGVVGLKMYWKKIKNLFSGKPKKRDDEKKSG